MVGEASLLVLAGFVLFPALLGAFFVSRNEAPGAWAATTVWALSVAALCVVIVILEVGSPSTDSLTALASLRHLLFGISMISALWVLQAISGNWHKVLTGIVVGLIVLRGILWFTTDLIWTHSLDQSGMPMLGVLAVPMVVVINGLTLTTVVMILLKPWRSATARRACAWSLVPTVALTFAMPFVARTTLDYFLVVILALPVIVVQAAMLSSLARQYREVKLRSIRDARLAEFGREALTPGGVVPGQAAVDLVVAELTDVASVYSELVSGRLRQVAKAGNDALLTGEPALTVPIESGGQVVGALTVYGRLELNEPGFIRGVGLVLSAALSRAAMEDRLREQALRDAITGLPNWALLQDRLNRLLTHGENRMVAVLCCDITELKAVNDEFGHDVGDALLREVGARLESISDLSGTVARIGADEFVVAQHVEDDDAAALLSNAAITISSQPMTLEGQSVPFEIRVGLVLTRDANADPDRLVRDAEIALMQAKAAVTRQAAYDKAAREAEDARRKMVRALAAGVANDEIFVEYQPILELATRRVVGVEALARWCTADGTLVPPLDFIPVAEANGLIQAITESVFDQALAQLAAWDALSSESAGLRLSLNATPNEVGTDEFIDWLTKLLTTHQVHPSRITLELTESALERAQDGVLRNLLILQELGIRLSLDDFGTGYSTFDRLLNLPVGELKIDRRFTKSGAGPHRKIVPSVVALAHSSDLVVVAEGIETQEQWHMLLADGCEYGQGYLFCRPLNGDRIPDYVRRSGMVFGHSTVAPPGA